MSSGPSDEIGSRATVPAGLTFDPALFARCFPGREPPHPDHFPLGDACPAVVVGRDPWLVAVFTDLNAKGSAGMPAPAIEVVGQPLDQMTGGPPPVGTRLVAPALYFADGADVVQWKGFVPIVAGCGCSNEQEIERALRAIDGVTWGRFLDSLRVLPSPAVPDRLYRLMDVRQAGEAAPAPLRVRPRSGAPAPPLARPSVHKMSLGIALFVTVVLGGLGAMLVQTYRTWWAVAGAAPFWLGAAWVLWTLGRRRVEIAAEGIAWTDKGRTRRAAWDDVAAYEVVTVRGAESGAHEVLQMAVAEVQRRRRRRFSKAADNTILVLAFADGERLALHLTYARGFEMFEAILDQVDPRIARRIVARVLRGETVSCGPELSLAPYGVVLAEEVLAWDEIGDCAAIDELVRVRARQGEFRPGGVPSPQAVAAAIRALRLAGA